MTAPDAGPARTERVTGVGLPSSAERTDQWRFATTRPLDGY
jgi:hypothetical protein